MKSDKDERNLLILWWPGVESNHRHEDFQSSALPTELPGHLSKLNTLKNYQYQRPRIKQTLT
jgi:hypothetical protein